MDTNLAFCPVTENNPSFRDTVTAVVPLREQRSKGVDVDVGAHVEAVVNLPVNCGFTEPQFNDADDLGLTNPISGPKIGRKGYHSVSNRPRGVLKGDCNAQRCEG